MTAGVARFGLKGRVVVVCRRVMVRDRLSRCMLVLVRGRPVVMLRVIVAAYSCTCSDDAMAVETTRE